MMKRVLAGPGVLLVLAGCAGTPPVPAPLDGSSTVVAAPAPLAAFEAAQLQRAQDLERKQQLADAAWAWEVMVTLRPDQAEYRECAAALRKRIDAAVAERLQRGQQAQKRGELDAASAQYLAALALQPQQAQASLAADGLRAIERERNRRNFLGQPSRITIARRNPSEFLQPAAPGRTEADAPDRNELEHITMLAAQGELDEAVALAEQRVAADKRDAAARQLLAELYVQQAEQLAAREQKQQALAVLQKSLKLSANHARATALLKQLRPAVPVTPAAPATAGTAPVKSTKGAGTSVGTAASTQPDTVPVDR